MKSDCPRIMIAAPTSGGGKTTVAISLLAALRARGLKPAAFKCGPDYVDPMFHREILGVPGGNLDLFLTPPETVRGLFRRGASGRDLSVVEGVMGYYDGVEGSDRASSWQVAAETGTPAVLVLTAKGTFLSLAAVATGFLRFREGSMIRGILLNRCGDRLAAKLAPALERETGLRVYGHIPDNPEASIESRHLGLVTPDAVLNIRDRVRRLAADMEKTVAVDGLVELAGSAPDLPGALPVVEAAEGTPVRIAVARDAAFCFYYEENFEMLRALGAEPVFFSPLSDSELPENIGGLYLGGGYPELHAQELAGNGAMRGAIGKAVASGTPTLAECGGFLYLQSRLADPEGREYPMVGAFGGTGRNAGRPVRFGYVRLRARRDNLLCDAGDEFPAHEFHYWDSDRNGDALVATKESGGGSWECGVANVSVFAGFPHLYFWGAPRTARRFVEAARERSGK